MAKRIIIIGSEGYVGSIITNTLRANGYDLYIPTSSALNLNSAQSISEALREESFAAIIYCAIENDKKNFVETNIKNLKNLLEFHNHFEKWIHISSRAVYDSLNQFEDILPLHVSQLKRPKDNPYSALKYEEESLLTDSIPQKVSILRVFDLYSKSDKSEITDRWEKQIKKKSFCKNEVLTPVSYKELCSAVVLAIDNAEITGVFNVCGNHKFSSSGMKGYVPNPDPMFYEHSGLNAMSDITIDWLMDYYHTFENRTHIVHLVDKNVKYKGYIDFIDGINSIESGAIVYHKLETPKDMPESSVHAEDIDCSVSALSIIPAFATELENYLLTISGGQNIYLDADDENASYIAAHLPHIRFSTNALSKRSFASMNCSYVLSIKLSKRLKKIVFKGAKVVLLNEILEAITLRQLLTHLGKNRANSLFIEGPIEEKLLVDKFSEPYLFKHVSLEEVINDKHYLKSFYRKDMRQLNYALDPNCGLLSGNMVTSNGIHLMSAFFKSDCLNVSSEGERKSNSSLIKPIERNIWIFGSCLTFGLFATDDLTPASLMQDIINKDHQPWQVHNMGVKGRNNILNDFVYAMNTQVSAGDVFVFIGIFSDWIKRELLVNTIDIHSFSEYLNQVGFGNNSFLNSSFHCNIEINHLLAEFIYNNLPPKAENLFTSKSVSFFDNSDKLPLIDSTKLLDMAFMKSYLNDLNNNKFNITEDNTTVGSIVMAANPFTLGHGGIIDKIATECDFFYVFIIEDSDFDIPFPLRLLMAEEYCSQYAHCKVLPTGNFFGARFLFPEYHNKQKYKDKPIKAPFIDTLVFAKLIAPLLGISRRYIGTEIHDNVTKQFNNHLMNVLPQYGIEARIIDRITLANGKPISASEARRLISEGAKVERLLKYLPQSTIDILLSKGKFEQS